MAGLDYFAILEATADVIRAAVPAATVGIEIETIPGAELCPYVAVYLEERQAIETEQRLAAGQRTHYTLRISIWCFAFSLNSLAEAKRLSWQLLDQVERALMADRTLGNASGAVWLLGGAMDLERGTKGSFVAGSELIVAARAVSAL